MLGIEIIVGSIAAGVVIFAVRKRKKAELIFWSRALIIVALIYVGFALFAANWEWLPTEVASVLIYGIPAGLAMYHSPWWLVLGWVAHVGWDVGLHYGGHPGFVPHWYPGACIGFDLTVAGYWVWKILEAKQKNKFSL